MVDMVIIILLKLHGELKLQEPMCWTSYQEGRCV